MMKSSGKSVLITVGLFVGAVLFVFSGPVSGGEEPYDEDTYGPGYPIVWTRPVKAVVFYHKTHTMDGGLECGTCHDSGLFEMAAGTAEENDDFTMNSLGQGKYCGACHNGDMAFDADTRCTTCHIGVKGYNRLTGIGSRSEPRGY